jgi:hypothetical protein
VLRLSGRAPLVSLAVSLWLDALACHNSGARDEKSVGGEGANLATNDVVVGLCHSILA